MIEEYNRLEESRIVLRRVFHGRPPLSESRGSSSIRRFSDLSRTSSPDWPADAAKIIGIGRTTLYDALQREAA
jgi:hypothetical protein